MNRILKRPMFRIGGSAGTGITSGLDQPRQQYSSGKAVAQAKRDALQFMQDPQLNPQMRGGFMPGSLSNFLTSFGLDMLSRPPTGNIFQTAAQSAKDPFAKFQERKMYEDVSKRDEERDLIKSYVDARATQLSESGGRDAFSHEAKQENI